MLNLIKPTLGFLKGLSLKDGFLIAAIIAIAILLTMKGCGSGKTKERASHCDSIKIELTDFRDLVATNYIHIDEAPKGIVIKEVDTLWRNHRAFKRNWNELEKQRALNGKLSRELSEVMEHNAKITKEQFEAGEVPVLEIDPSMLLPIVETTKRDSTDTYELTMIVESLGDLRRFEHRISVKPKILEVTKTQIEYLKKNSFVAINGGALYLNDQNELNYTTSIQYGKKFWNVELGPVWDEKFKFNGMHLKAGFVIRLKK